MIVCSNPIQINKQLEKLLFEIISHDQKIIFTGRIGSTSYFFNRSQSAQKDWRVYGRQQCEHADESAF